MYLLTMCMQPPFSKGTKSRGEGSRTYNTFDTVLFTCTVRGHRCHGRPFHSGLVLTSLPIQHNVGQCE